MKNTLKSQTNKFVLDVMAVSKGKSYSKVYQKSLVDMLMNGCVSLGVSVSTLCETTSNEDKLSEALDALESLKRVAYILELLSNDKLFSRAKYSALVEMINDITGVLLEVVRIANKNIGNIQKAYMIKTRQEERLAQEQAEDDLED